MAIAKFWKTWFHGQTKKNATAEEHPGGAVIFREAVFPGGRQIKLHIGLWSCGPGRKGHYVTKVAQGISRPKQKVMKVTRRQSSSIRPPQWLAHDPCDQFAKLHTALGKQNRRFWHCLVMSNVRVSLNTWLPSTRNIIPINICILVWQDIRVNRWGLHSVQSTAVD